MIYPDLGDMGENHVGLRFGSHVYFAVQVEVGLVRKLSSLPKKNSLYHDMKSQH